jgi:hypothetical protein
MTRLSYKTVQLEGLPIGALPTRRAGARAFTKVPKARALDSKSANFRIVATQIISDREIACALRPYTGQR